MPRKEKNISPKRLTVEQEEMYIQRRKLKARINKLEKSVRELKEQRDELDEVLIPIFEEHPKRKLRDGKTIVVFEWDGRDAKVVTKDMKVGDVITEACEWPKYTEVVND